MNSLLDDKTLGAVLQAGPSDYHEDEQIALRLVEFLLWNMDQGAAIEVEGLKIYEMKVGDLAEKYGNPEINARKIGHVVQQMGLQAHRRREGYVIAYTVEQIRILHQYFHKLT